MEAFATKGPRNASAESKVTIADSINQVTTWKWTYPTQDEISISFSANVTYVTCTPTTF
jgi:hypothetical protein